MAVEQGLDLEGGDRAARARSAIAPSPEADVAARGQVRKEAGVLGHVADAPGLGRPAAPGRGIEQGLAVEHDAPARPGRKPQTASSSDVLPEPDGPITPVTPPPRRAATRSGEAGQRQLEVELDHGAAAPRARRRVSHSVGPEGGEGQDRR